jgi:putative membrane protein insertion efficiency factor
MIARLLMALIRVYQLTLSKLIRMTLGNVCRFEPSCSRYAFACIRDHGALRGGLLSAKRLCRCHPFHPGGFDPPPPPRSDARALRSKMSSAVGQSTPPAAEAPGKAHDPSQRSSA